MKFKPRIYFEDNFWRLEYNFPARSFSLFGMDALERLQYKRQLRVKYKFKTWRQALESLCDAFRNRQVVIYVE